MVGAILSSPLMHLPLVIPLIDGLSILDVGCGRGKWGYLMRVDWWATRKGERDKEPELLVGVDLFLPFLSKVRYHRIYDDVVYCHASYLPFATQSFDVVLASEILEHIPKEQGLLLLQEAERIAKKSVIITTPHLAFRRRGGLPTPEGFNPLERHVQRWTVKQLRERGYHVWGVGLFPMTYFKTLNFILSPISYLVPQIATHLVAMKQKRGQVYQGKVTASV